MTAKSTAIQTSAQPILLHTHTCNLVVCDLIGVIDDTSRKQNYFQRIINYMF